MTFLAFASAALVRHTSLLLFAISRHLRRSRSSSPAASSAHPRFPHKGLSRGSLRSTDSEDDPSDEKATTNKKRPKTSSRSLRCRSLFRKDEEHCFESFLSRPPPGSPSLCFLASPTDKGVGKGGKENNIKHRHCSTATVGVGGAPCLDRVLFRGE